MLSLSNKYSFDFYLANFEASAGTGVQIDVEVLAA